MSGDEPDEPGSGGLSDDHRPGEAVLQNAAARVGLGRRLEKAPLLKRCANAAVATKPPIQPFGGAGIEAVFAPPLFALS